MIIVATFLLSFFAAAGVVHVGAAIGQGVYAAWDRRRTRPPGRKFPRAKTVRR